MGGAEKQTLKLIKLALDATPEDSSPDPLSPPPLILKLERLCANVEAEADFWLNF